MYLLKNLPRLNFTYNELRAAATQILQMFEKVIKELELEYEFISEVESEDGSIFFTFFEAELKLQAEIPPKGIQMGKGKLITYRENPLTEEQEKLDIEFDFDESPRITYEENGKVVEEMHINVFPKKYIEFVTPILLENYTIILDK